jgi:hypothetical protein
MSKPLSVGVEQQNYLLVEAHKQAISTKKILPRKMSASCTIYLKHIKAALPLARTIIPGVE